MCFKDGKCCIFFIECLILNPVEYIYNLVIAGKRSFFDCITTFRRSCGGTCTALITDFLKSVTTSSGLSLCIINYCAFKEAG